jgi:hypothetical protein
MPLTTTAPTTTSETPIPSDYTTYTSEGLFSISYPPDWLPQLSMMRAFEEESKELITSIESDLPMENSLIVFSAGVLTEEGYHPHVGITVNGPPVVNWTLDSVVEAMLDNPDLEESVVFSQVKTTIGGREAVIIDFQINIPIQTFGDTTFGGEYHYITMITLVSKTAWKITCMAGSPEIFSDYEEDFYAILNSFRMLN